MCILDYVLGCFGPVHAFSRLRDTCLGGGVTEEFYTQNKEEIVVSLLHWTMIYEGHFRECAD
jgi:hypothetical protein